MRRRTIKRKKQIKRVRTREGDWYVETSDYDWPIAIAKMKRAAIARDARMAEWEKKHHKLERSTSPEYWKKYNKEKYRIPIEYPMPEGHLMFKERS